MIKKRSSRLISWLLAMIMIFNIAPIPAFAAGDGNQVDPENDKNSPPIITESGYSVIKTESLSTAQPPQDQKDFFLPVFPRFFHIVFCSFAFRSEVFYK